MDRPRLYIDTNEQIDSGLYLLSKGDVKQDSSGANVYLHAGDRVFVYMDETDELGNPDNLIASGTVEQNIDPRWPHVKWCFRIDELGVMNESEASASASGSNPHR
jgi:hypothetical protein